MSKLNKRSSLQVVSGLAELQIPDEILKQANVQELLLEIGKTQRNVKNSSEKLTQARREHADGNVFGNYINNRSDAIRDANADLAVSVGELTTNSTKLLVFNTAISKVLLDQQYLLAEQQKQLERQTRFIQTQNEKITKNQDALKSAHEQLGMQQEDLIAVNRGLIAAEGITLEHAKQLTKLVEKAENLESSLVNKTIAWQADLIKHIEELENKVTQNISYIKQFSLKESEQLEALINKKNIELQELIDILIKGQQHTIDHQLESHKHYVDEIVRDLKLTYEANGNDFLELKSGFIKDLDAVNRSVDSIREVTLEKSQTENKKIKSIKNFSMIGLAISFFSLACVAYLITNQGIL